MKRVILLFLVFAGLTFGSCRRQTVMPQFDIVVTDTVAVRGGIPCRFQYAFTSIANADEAPALQAIQESNMLYFFGLEHFQGGVQEALIGLIRNKLYEQFGVTGDEGLVAQGFFPEYISTTENFEVTEDGITFYYNPYDIGCYALGGVEVHITREEMQGL